MIRCSTLHDLQCLCRQKCCTILIFQLFQFEFLATTAAKLSQKYASWEKLCIQGMLNSVPFLTAISELEIARQFARIFFFSVMEPYLPVRGVGWDWVVASNCTMAGLFFQGRCWFVNESVFLTWNANLWNKRKGLQKKGHSGPLAEISLSAQLLI